MRCLRCVYLDGNTIVELDPRDPPELHGEAEAVAQPEVLGHVLQVPGHVPGEAEVAEVAGRQEHVGLEEIAEASHLRLEGQRGVKVEARGPEEAASEAVSLRARPDPSCVETSDTERSS